MPFGADKLVRVGLTTATAKQEDSVPLSGPARDKQQPPARGKAVYPCVGQQNSWNTTCIGYWQLARQNGNVRVSQIGGRVNKRQR